MTKNPILEELYDIRREILSEHREDLADYLRAELAKSKAAGHPIATIKQRTIRRTLDSGRRELQR
jgi:hypothetical protein